MKSSLGKIFGGFTSKNWTSENLVQKDLEAFLFSLTFESKHDVLNKDYAISGWKKYLCVFGNITFTKNLLYSDLIIFGKKGNLSYLGVGFKFSDKII